MAGKTWFITGTSRGLGRQWAEAALGRGDNVAAVARDATTRAEYQSRVAVWEDWDAVTEAAQG
jgi:NAD(P)-dependent dehydrogenase (short-subunit alcohol dehydrogenase family)